MNKNKIISLFIFVLITYLASFIASFATLTSKEPWYSSLIKSNLTPPDWVFAPVWTTLYLLMALAIWICWNKKNQDIYLVVIYLIHLFFNTTWSIIFFVFHNILFAMINLAIILFFIIILMKRYKKISNLSFYLMIPYLIWSCYALILNVTLFYLN